MYRLATIARLELVQRVLLDRGQQFGWIEQQNHPVQAPIIDYAIDQPVTFTGQIRRWLNRVGLATDHFGDTVDDQAGTMPLGTNHDEPSAAIAGELWHIEAPALIDDRQDLPSQIDHAFEEVGHFRNPRDLRWDPRNFIDRRDRQAESLIAQSEDDEVYKGTPCRRS